MELNESSLILLSECYSVMKMVKLLHFLENGTGMFR